MATNVEFEKPPGTPWPSTNFESGDRIAVVGNVTGSLNLPAWGSSVRVEVFSKSRSFAPIIADDRAGFAGNFGVEFNLPRVTSQAIVRVTTHFVVGDPDIVEIPIGIGAGVFPGPPPRESTPLANLTKGLVIGGIVVGGVIALPYLLPLLASLWKLAPKRKR